ncbi:MAG: hypothetical protein K2G75_05580 [Muribaculaceae bacterium]|nr:hypothetical protein [Muribaculaceae bacterium]MDE6330018.1 hypothetical protein [Muribaculaceae bacterium]
MGFELANLIQNDLNSPHLPLIAEDCFNSLLRQSILHDEIIGDYVAITNWGILFEPNLKFNLLSLFDSFSKSHTLILVDCGQAEYDTFHLVDKRFNTALPIGNLHPYIIK